MMSPRRKGSWEPSWAEKSNWACTNLGLLTWRKVEGRGWWGRGAHLCQPLCTGLHCLSPQHDGDAVPLHGKDQPGATRA